MHHYSIVLLFLMQTFQFKIMKTVCLIIILAILPMLLASRENRWEGEDGEELREKRVHIVRNEEEGRFPLVNERTENSNEDDEDDNEDEEEDGNNEASNDDQQNGRDSVEASGADDDKNENSVNDDDGDDDDDDEGKNEAQKVVCKRRCAPPMTFDQCANPRCAMKHSIVKELCYYLCRHQQIRCRETCEPE